MNEKSPDIAVERVERFAGRDLADLCDASETAILEGGGFGWLTPPPRKIMERYWRGVLLVPERELFVGRLGGTIAGFGPARPTAAQQRGPELRGLDHHPLRRSLGARPRACADARARGRGRGA